MPTFILTHWGSRSAQGGEQFLIEFLVRKLTRDTAMAYGMADRGAVEAGPAGRRQCDRLRGACGSSAPEAVYDLPAGGRRLVQRAEGYCYTVKSKTLDPGRSTGALPGPR